MANIQIDTKFTTLITKYAAQLLNLSTVMKTGITSLFTLDKVGRTSSETSIKETLGREDINKAWLEAAKGGEDLTCKDNIITKMQLTWMSGLERDLRQRYKSRIRIKTHEMARKIGHAHPQGPWNKDVIYSVNSIGLEHGET